MQLVGGGRLPTGPMFDSNVAPSTSHDGVRTEAASDLRLASPSFGNDQRMPAVECCEQRHDRFDVVDHGHLNQPWGATERVDNR